MPARDGGTAALVPRPDHSASGNLCSSLPGRPLAPTGGAGTLRLSTNPANEVFERWSAVWDSVMLLALFSLSAAFLCSASVGRAMMPLTGLSAGLRRLGQGEADVRLLETGPPEIAALARAFNQLSEALRTVQAQNIRLQTQILTLAEEERAEIARDLHDEVGPHLFAITTFAATIGRQLAERDARRAGHSWRAIPGFDDRRAARGARDARPAA